MKKAVMIAGLVMLCAGICFAGELITGQGIDYYNDGVKAQKAGNSDQAMMSYQKAMLVGLDVVNYRTYIFNNVAAIYAEQGDFSKAEEMWLEALKINPEYKAANFNIAVLYMKQGLCSKALDYLMKANSVTGSFVVEEVHVPDGK